ncbi:MAG: hypothetical protein U0992_24590 [Planctomycetaceae bacterium]
MQCIEIGESPTNGQLILLLISPHVSGCDVCLRVCPGVEVDFPTLNRGSGTRTGAESTSGWWRTYVGHAADQDVCHASPSEKALRPLLAYR